MRLLKSFFRFVINSIVLSVAVTGIIVYLYGTTTVNASIDGKPLKGAIVEVNGKYVGETPYAERLYGLNRVVIIVDSHDTLEIEQEWTLFSTGLGTDIRADFTSP